MIATALLVACLLAASYTDVRWRKVFNWTTYPGALIALAGSGLATWLGVDAAGGSEAAAALYGFVPLHDSLAGLLLCGAAMLVCYVFFPGGVGGGDVKLIAMIGAFLGVEAGLEAMLWTFVLGGCAALIVLIWRFGLVALATRFAQHLWRSLWLGRLAPPAADDRRSLQSDMFLSPSALAAVLIVRFGVLPW